MAGAIDSAGRRKDALDAFLETKLQEGFEIEMHRDTHAIGVAHDQRKSFLSRFRGSAPPIRCVGRRARRGDDDPGRAETQLTRP